MSSETDSMLALWGRYEWTIKRFLTRQRVKVLGMTPEQCCQAVSDLGFTLDDVLDSQR